MHPYFVYTDLYIDSIENYAREIVCLTSSGSELYHSQAQCLLAHKVTVQDYASCTYPR